MISTTSVINSINHVRNESTKMGKNVSILKKNVSKCLSPKLICSSISWKKGKKHEWTKKKSNTQDAMHGCTLKNIGIKNCKLILPYLQFPSSVHHMFLYSGICLYLTGTCIYSDHLYNRQLLWNSTVLGQGMTNLMHGNRSVSEE